MAGTNVPKFHNEDVTPHHKLMKTLTKQIIAFGNRVDSDRFDFATICDEVINKDVCAKCILGQVCMSSKIERI